MRGRVYLTAAYFIVCFVILFYESRDNSFCSRADGPGPMIVTARLALLCTAWDLLASGCGAILFAAAKNNISPSRVERALLIALIAGVGFFAIPFGFTEDTATSFLKTPLQT